jgi:phage terminase large subunit-like protein
VESVKQSDRARSETHKQTLAENTLQQQVEREMARRELARRRLLYFTRRFEGQKVDEASGELVEIERAKGTGYVADWVHKDVCARLERFLVDVRAGRQPRLMLFMPPRHGKSTLASRMFPAWAFGQDPTLEVIAASYGASLPEQFSRNVRGVLRDPEYRTIFPETQMDPERENVQGWATTQNGMYIPVGVGSGITGKGADLLIIDDPFKGAEDAENPNAREKVVDWYFSEAYTRLSPNAGVLVILTRWHDADLAGALISAQQEQETESLEILDSEIEEIRAAELSKKEEAQALQIAQEEHKDRLKDVEKWEVVSYAAQAEQDEYRMPNGQIVHSDRRGAVLLRKTGEALHPSRYPIERLSKIKKNFYARGRQRFWHALYQQKPVPDEGIHFSREMVRITTPESDQVRAGWLKLSAWDLAAGQDAQHDWTVGAHGQMDYEGRVHVTQITRGRFDGAHGVACAVLDEYERNRPQMIGVEKGPLEKFLMPSIKKELADRNREANYKNRLTPVFAEGKQFALAPIQDPVLRAGPLQSLMQQGMLVFDKDIQWMEDAIGELIRFPGGVHDDIVTALSWLARLMLRYEVPNAPTMKQRQRSWKTKLNAYMRKGTSGHMGA